VTDSPVKAWAAAHRVWTLQPERLARVDFETTFASLGAELGVVAAYGKILPEWLIQLPRLGMINVHASLLPKYRGAAPVHRAVIAGETVTGITIMRVVKPLDAGPMLAQASHPIGPDATSVEVEDQLARLGADLLCDAVDALAENRATETPQDESLATYAPRLSRDDGLIDWARPAAAIHNLVRGLHPWPRAFTFLDGARHILHRTQLTSGEASAPAGTLVQASPGALSVVCGDGQLLEIRELQIEGRHAMPADAFLAGHAIAPGARYG
jgi:methionyl-tRNA formyltransferase